MKKARHAEMSACAGSVVGKTTQDLNARSTPTAQDHLRTRRAIAPPLGAVSGDTVSRILMLTALHVRKTLPATSHLTLDELEHALADLRMQFEAILVEDDHLLDSPREED